MRHSLIIILALTVLISCNKKLRLNKQQKSLSDKSKTEYYQKLQQTVGIVSDSLTFTNIRNGSDSFEFRLWTPTKGKHYSVISIEYYNDTWLMSEVYFKKHSAKRVAINIDNPDFDDLLSDTTHDWILEIPITDKDAIIRLVDTLKQFDIKSIPTQNLIPNLTANGNKGYRYIIEYATKGNYKLIEYIRPNLFDDEYNRTITDLIKLLQRYATDIVF